MTVAVNRIPGLSGVQVEPGARGQAPGGDVFHQHNRISFAVCWKRRKKKQANRGQQHDAEKHTPQRSPAPPRPQ